jgi:prepilin signal peptidase PulO-like enzyme (type II secretory pathway)
VVNRNATSPVPFVGMSGMACAFFLYAASPVAGVPWWGTTLLMVLWLVMLVIGCAWWTPHPKRLLVLPVFACALWFGVILGGAIVFDWGQ